MFINVQLRPIHFHSGESHQHKTLLEKLAYLVIDRYTKLHFNVLICDH